MSLYTHRGDTGETSLFNGDRVPKDAARVDAYGALDEACAAIGLARTTCYDKEVAQCLQQLHHKLMTCGASLANPDYDPAASIAITEKDIATIEKIIDDFSERVGSLGDSFFLLALQAHRT